MHLVQGVLHSTITRSGADHRSMTPLLQSTITTKSCRCAWRYSQSLSIELIIGKKLTTLSDRVADEVETKWLWGNVRIKC